MTRASACRCPVTRARRSRVSLSIEQDTLLPVRAVAVIDGGANGTFNLTLTLSKFNAPVSISPPPPDQVVEASPGLMAPFSPGPGLGQGPRPSAHDEVAPPAVGRPLEEAEVGLARSGRSRPGRGPDALEAGLA